MLFNNISNREGMRVFCIFRSCSKARELIYANTPLVACLFPFPFRSHFFREKSGRGGEGGRGRGGEGYGASGEIKTNYELFKFSCAGSLSQQMKMSTDIFILIMDTSHLSELTRSFSVEIGPQ